MTPAQRWRDALAGWAIPDDVLADAEASPWALAPASFVRRTERRRDRPSPAHRVLRDVLPARGSVLDLGCGAGAGTVPLVPPAARATGVDESRDMLAAYAEQVRRAGAEAATVTGRWPDVAHEVAEHDVVVAQDVAYNVPDLDEFVQAATGHARHRVAVVLPGRHPMTWTRPYWRRLHGLDRPAGPTAQDAVAVVASTGAAVHTTTWREPASWGDEDPDDTVARIAQRLCLPSRRRDEVAAALADLGMPATRVLWCLWWDVA